MTVVESVYVADTLQRRHPGLHDELRRKLALVNVELREIRGTRDIWCRDYMPVPIGGSRYVQFRYEPDYLADAPELVTPPEVAEPLVGVCRRSMLVVDAGNVVRRGDVAIVTEKIFIENPTLTRKNVTRQLREELEIERLVIIPVEPGDVFGHADGVLFLLDEQAALVNNYNRVDRAYGRAVASALLAVGIEPVVLPYAPDLSSNARVPSATGVYANLLETQRTTFIPRYALATDDMVADVLRCLGRTIVQVDCRRLAHDGGSLHCVTWTSA